MASIYWILNQQSDKVRSPQKPPQGGEVPMLSLHRICHRDLATCPTPPLSLEPYSDSSVEPRFTTHSCPASFYSFTSSWIF